MDTSKESGTMSPSESKPVRFDLSNTILKQLSKPLHSLSSESSSLNCETNTVDCICSDTSKQNEVFVASLWTFITIRHFLCIDFRLSQAYVIISFVRWSVVFRCVSFISELFHPKKCGQPSGAASRRRVNWYLSQLTIYRTLYQRAKRIHANWQFLLT